MSISINNWQNSYYFSPTTNQRVYISFGGEPVSESENEDGMRELYVLIRENFQKDSTIQAYENEEIESSTFNSMESAVEALTKTYRDWTFVDETAVPVEVDSSKKGCSSCVAKKKPEETFLV